MSASSWVVLGALVVLIAVGAIVTANCHDLGLLGTYCKPITAK